MAAANVVEIDQPCVLLDTTQESWKERSLQLGETTLVPAFCLWESNFQKIYKGTGTPVKPDGESVLSSVADYAKELAIPLFTVNESRAAWQRLEHFKNNQALYGLVDFLPITPWHQAAMVMLPSAVIGVGLNMAQAYRSGKEDAGRHGEGIVDEGRMRGEELRNAFCLDLEEGPFILYSSETKISESTKWHACRRDPSWAEQVLGPLTFGFGVGSNRISEVKREVQELKFYKAINSTLALDDLPRLSATLPFIKMFNWYVNQTRHPGGTVYSGVSVSMEKVSPLLKKGNKLRIPRILSTSELRNVASDHVKSDNGLTGLLLSINIPENFWGARQVASVSQYPWEAEVVFPAWSQFLVREVLLSATPPELHLEAIDKYAQ